MTLKLVVPLDGSALSETAVPVAERLAHDANAEVCLLEITPPAHGTGRLAPGWEPIGPGNYGFRREPQVRELETVTQEAERQDADALGYLGSVASRFPGMRVTCRVRSSSDVAEEILSGANAWGADLIVMATNGRTGLLHLLLGSVAERVLRTSAIPVLMVRPHHEA